MPIIARRWVLSVSYQTFALLVFWQCATLAAAQVMLNNSGVAVLNDYVNAGTRWQSRGTWYNILDWAARSTSCSDAPDSVACMACSQSMPAYSKPAGVAPIAVSNELWFSPSKGAVCGMCVKIYMQEGMPSAACNSDSTATSTHASCPGMGTHSYLSSVNESWAWGAKIYPAEDPINLPHFIGVIIEWFDRNQTIPYELTYPTQNVSTADFGTWPIVYEGDECPVGNLTLQYHFLNVSTVIGTTGDELCDNQADKPCGEVQADASAFKYMAFKAIGERIPIAGMQVRLFPGASFIDMARTSADYWQIKDYAQLPVDELDPKNAVDMLIECSDGQRHIELGLVPAKMFCSFQDPDCEYTLGTVQC